MAKINVKDTEVTVLQINNEDYISLTDMVKAKEGEFFVTSWLRNRNTVEYIGIWENINNPDFHYIEFGTIKNAAGSDNFSISVKDLIEQMNTNLTQYKNIRYTDDVIKNWPRNRNTIEFNLDFKPVIFDGFRKDVENRKLLK
jgi:hypothetical protein